MREHVHSPWFWLSLVFNATGLGVLSVLVANYYAPTPPPSPTPLYRFGDEMVRLGNDELTLPAVNMLRAQHARLTALLQEVAAEPPLRNDRCGEGQMFRGNGAFRPRCPVSQLPNRSVAQFTSPRPPLLPPMPVERVAGLPPRLRLKLPRSLFVSDAQAEEVAWQLGEQLAQQGIVGTIIIGPEDTPEVAPPPVEEPIPPVETLTSPSKRRLASAQLGDEWPAVPLPQTVPRPVRDALAERDEGGGRGEEETVSLSPSPQPKVRDTGERAKSEECQSFPPVYAVREAYLVRLQEPLANPEGEAKWVRLTEVGLEVRQSNPPHSEGSLWWCGPYSLREQAIAVQLTLQSEGWQASVQPACCFEPTGASSGERWGVQLGAFLHRPYAEGLHRSLPREFPARLVSLPPFWKVLLGPLATEEQARLAARRVTVWGYEGFPVRWPVPGEEAR